MKCILMSCMVLDQEYVMAEVSKIIKPNMKVVCIPFASDLQWLLNGKLDEYKERHFRPFEKYGIKEFNDKCRESVWRRCRLQITALPLFSARLRWN